MAKRSNPGIDATVTRANSSQPAPETRVYAGHILLSLVVLGELAYLICAIGRAGMFTTLLLQSHTMRVPAITLLFLLISPAVARSSTMLYALLLVLGVLLIRRARLATSQGNARTGKAAACLAATAVIMNVALFVSLPPSQRNRVIPVLLVPRHVPSLDR
ncbi:MAG: hypothetical protein ACLQVD_11790 [Capsulimonadaceae bacterium]